MEKQKLANGVIDAIELHRSGFREKIEVIDVSTPLTRERYTGNWIGAMQAFAPNSNLVASIFSNGDRYTVPNLENFYMAGQWVESWGGITTTAQSGRKVIAAICKRERKTFQTVQ